MRSKSALIAGIVGAALLVGMPAVAKTDRAAAAAAAGEAKLAKALDGRVAGEPVRCISMRSIRSSKVIDNTAILYEIGGKLYLNRPTSGASTLDDDDVLVTKTSGDQLCDLDIVRLIDRTAHFPRGFVSLGQFVPYTKVPKAS